MATVEHPLNRIVPGIMSRSFLNVFQSRGSEKGVYQTGERNKRSTDVGEKWFYNV